MKKKLTFDGKQNLAKPVEADRAELVSLTVNFRDGSMEIVLAMMDGDSMALERPIHCGLSTADGLLDLDKLEADTLSVAQNCGALPSSTAEED